MKYNVHLYAIVSTLLLASAPAQAQIFNQNVPGRLISVVGTAKQEVPPDQAVLSGQLVSKSKQLADAKTANDKLVERVLAVSRQFNVPKERVTASNVYISPEYTYNNATNKQEMQGYIVSRNLSIRMDDLTVHERLLSALINNGIDQVNGVNFTIANPDEKRDALRVMAVQDARNRAQSLAQAAGARLGKVVSISTTDSSPPPMIPMRAAMMEKGSVASDSVAPSLPGMNTLSESVNVTFELE